MTLKELIDELVRLREAGAPGWAEVRINGGPIVTVEHVGAVVQVTSVPIYKYGKEWPC